MNNERPARPRSSGSRGFLLIIMGPILALGAFTALLALAAGLSGWHRTEMLAIGASTGALVSLLTLLLLYRRLAERKADQRALQSVQARVGGILESAMDAIISVDEEQRIVLFNAAAEQVFRWPRSAVVGQPLDMLMPEAYRQGHAAHIRRFSETGVTSRRMGDKTVLKGLRSNGEEFPVEASISQHVEDGKKLFTVILRDVSERLKAEEDSARDEARLRGILDSAMDAIITVDESQRIVLFNAAAETVFLCPRDQAMGAPLSWFIPERFRSGHAEHMKRFGESASASRRMGTQRIVTGLRRNGEEFPIEASISRTAEHGATFYTVILRDVTERARAEDALKHSKEELRKLAVATNSVREQEKSRIARELHDELAQSLTALKMDTAWLLDLIPSGQASIVDKLRGMQTTLDHTVAATRRISSDLRPIMLDDLGLVPAAEWLVQNFSARSGIACELGVPEELDLDDPYATAIFRILQESLTNISKHAQATKVTVSITEQEGVVTLEVRDNGMGFVTGAPRKPNSFGLIGLRERAQLLDGEAEIRSIPGQGTHILVRIPVKEALLP